MNKLIKNKRVAIILCIAMLFAIIVLPMGGCKDKTPPQEDNNPYVIITLASGEEIKLELFPDVAPISVQNFLQYVNDGFYNNTVFHRVIADFMIQGGAYTFADGTMRQKEGVREQIIGEFAENGITNNLKHTAGVISMARTAVNNSASSQFFICTDMPKEQADYLDGKYAAFGKVTNSASLNVVRRLAAAETTTYYDDNSGVFEDFPVQTIRIVSVVQTR